MAQQSHKLQPIGHENLENWEPIGSGGFGLVYKARHKVWCFDVAIKILHDGVSLKKEGTLFAEAYYMETASCEYVLRVYGIYQAPPDQGGLLKQGIVMEYMGNGSVQSLLNKLGSPPPWPLAFRLANEVALGMNFLHSRKLIHHDLKPSNVLLSDDLKAKLADFGLCRVSTSASCGNKDRGEVCGGSYKYMPPEAFDTSYKPVRSFDRYSYGILLWTILSGKEPYPDAGYNLVELRIPSGDRPPLNKIELQKAEGLEELVDLMKRCWDGERSNRPTFEECLKVTQKVFRMHERGVRCAVDEVIKKLESSTGTQHNDHRALSFTPLTPEQTNLKDSLDGSRLETKKTSIQASVSISAKRMSTEEKAKFVDNNRAELTQNISEIMAIIDELGDMVHKEAYAQILAKPTSMDKTRELYQRTLRSGEEAVKAAFFDALKKHEPRLVERLGG